MDTAQRKNNVKILLNQAYNNFIKKELSSNQWFSDETISLPQILLHKKFPLPNGFEDATLVNLKQPSKKVSVVQKNNFVLIIHDNNHCVTMHSDSAADKSIIYFCDFCKSQN